MGNGIPENDGSVTTFSVMKSAVKFGIIGVILGAFIVCGGTIVALVRILRWVHN